jgi:hypothetical protein
VTEYRAGQRVRIEWLDGIGTTAIEGPLVVGDMAALRVEYGPDGRDWFYVGSSWWESAATVTILSEPRPEEPTGLGAVVEAEWANGGGVSPPTKDHWVRLPNPDGGRWWHDGVEDQP